MSLFLHFGQHPIMHFNYIDHSLFTLINYAFKNLLNDHKLNWFDAEGCMFFFTGLFFCLYTHLQFSVTNYSILNCDVTSDIFLIFCFKHSVRLWHYVYDTLMSRATWLLISCKMWIYMLPLGWCISVSLP